MAATRTPRSAASTDDEPPALNLAPDSFLAADSQGNLVEVSPAGKVRGEVVADVETGGVPGHIALTADRGTLYFDRGKPGCWQEFAWYGRAGVSGLGAWPTPSPDNSKVAAITGDDPCRPDTLLVYDVVTGTSRSWHIDRRLASRHLHLTGPLSWSATGELAVGFADATTREVRVVDLDAGDVLYGWAVTPTRDGGTVLDAFFTGTGSAEHLVTLESCCGAKPTYRLNDRTRESDRAGQPLHSVQVPRPRDLDVTATGGVTLTTPDGTVRIGPLTALHAVTGRYEVAAGYP